MSLTLFSIEGNIGAGKTTLLEELKKERSFLCLEEPISKWTDRLGENLLNLFYKEPKVWAFTFQLSVMRTMCSMLENSISNKPIVTERSLLTTSAFISLCFKKRWLTYSEKCLLEDSKNILIKRLRIKNQIVIYLNTSVWTCFIRMKRRNREEEKDVTLEYLAKLEFEIQKTIISNAFKKIFIIFESDNYVKTVKKILRACT